MRIFATFLLLALIAFPTIMVQNSNGLAYAQEDDVLDEEADVASEDEEIEAAPVEATEEDEEEDTGPKKSPDAESSLLFVKPRLSGELPAGEVVHTIVGFKNVGKKDFIVRTMDASFRYPQDFNYFIQNFTALQFHKTVEASRQASFEYSFVPSDNFNGRPFGLVITLNYEDADGKIFQDAVFNDTVMIVDPVEGFDSETFFLYITLAALAILVIVALQQTVFSSATKRLTKPKVEMGTQNNSDIDYDWIPKENLQVNRRTSPRRRRGDSGTASSGSGDER